MTITLANAGDAARLFDVWESSVRATHHFLAERDIQAPAPIVRRLLQEFSPIHCLRDEAGVPFAFLGVADGVIEMLFVHAARRGDGAGRTLVEFAVRECAARAVDVNEQNEPACGFYRHMGFETVRRSETDPFGNPFPILHLACKNNS